MIKINIYEIIMQMINFLILFWILNKILFKPIMKFLNKREELIKQEIAATENSKAEAERFVDEQKAILQSAHMNARNILQQAEEDSQKGASQIILEAKNEAEIMIKNAKNDLNADLARTKEELKNYVGDLAINLTEKIISKNIDKKDQEKVIQEYLNTVKN